MDKRVAAGVCYFATDLHQGSLGREGKEGGEGDGSLGRAGDIKGELIMVCGAPNFGWGEGRANVCGGHRFLGRVSFVIFEGGQ